LTTDIVKSGRIGLSAIVLLVAITGATTVPAFAGLTHPVCASRHHDCGDTAKVSECCCGDAQASQTDSTPVQSRTEFRADLSSMTAVSSAVPVALPPHAVTTVHTSPPHRSHIDLPTFFSSLLI